MSRRIHAAAFVDPLAVLGDDVEVGPGAVIEAGAVIGDRTRVAAHALVTAATRIGADCHLHHGAVAGSPPQDLKWKGTRSHLEIGDRTVIREYATLNVGTEEGATTRVGSDCLLMAYAHVAHDCHVGDRVVVANSVHFGGYVTVDDWAIVGGGSVVHQFTRIGRHCMIGGGSRVVQDIAPYIKAAGNPPRLGGVNRIGLERRGVAADVCNAIEGAYRLLYRDNLTVTAAVAAMRERWPLLPEVEHFARFAETSLRGLTR
jgi:UDP-N-acetylglucosamine acyltransferase